MPTPTIAITHDHLLGVEARTTDPLAAALLRHAGFRPAFTDTEQTALPEELRGLHSLPYDLAGYDLHRAAIAAAEMLRAARFRVDLDPDLYVGPSTTLTDPAGTKFVGAAVLDATDLLAAATDPPAACRPLDQVLDPDDGALARIAEFFDVAADKARSAGEPLSALAHDLDVAADLALQMCERMEKAAEAVRPVEPNPAPRPDAATTEARTQAAARARAAGAPALQREPVQRSANHRIAAPLPRPSSAPLGGRR